MPDIDIDFCQSRRAEVISYVQDKYGRDCTANIITFNAMLAKGAVRDVGRVMEKELAEVNRIAKLIPMMPGKKVVLKAAPKDRTDADQTTYAIDDVPELKELYQQDPTVQEMLDLARKCEGIARNTGCHAAGLVIADKPVTEYCPLYQDKNGMMLTQYEMSHIDSVGLLKIDFLGLETLTKLMTTTRLIKARRGTAIPEKLDANGELDLDSLSLDDVKTYKMLGRGDARAVFQFESEGMRKLLVDARPDCLEDLVALNAMYRPGPMDNIPSFCNRKHGREAIEYPLAQLEPLLKDTYGIIVYQEQVMQIANQLAGFSLSEADSLRKAMGKKKKDLMEKYGKQFVEGCAKNGIDPKKAQDLYDLIAKFAEYGFNKSHAAAYAFVAYQTAYLKANYPAEFMAGNMSLEQGNTDKIVEYIDEARRMGLDVAPPDINTSGVTFTIEGEHLLRFSLGAVKGVGEKAVEAIVAERNKNGKFKDLYDLCERVDSKSVNKGCLESLIKAGALDSIGRGSGRAALMGTVEDSMAHGARTRDDRNSGQGNLFGGDDGGGQDSAPKLRMAQVAEWTEKQRLDEEKAVLGFYFSGHPLAEARELVEGLSSCTIKGMSNIPEGYEVVIGAYVTQVQPRITRAKGEKMAVLTIEDFSGNTQAVIFPRTYKIYAHLLQPDTILFFKGKLKSNEMGGGGANGKDNAARAEGDDSRPPQLAIMPDEIMSVEEAAERFVSDVTLLLDEQDPAKTNKNANGNKNENGNGNTNGGGSLKARLQSMLTLMKEFDGKIPVYFKVELDSGSGSTGDGRDSRRREARLEADAGIVQGIAQNAEAGIGAHHRHRHPGETRAGTAVEAAASDRRGVVNVI